MPGIGFDPSAEPTRFIYERLADHIAQLIERGQLLPDQPLPAERRLVAECGVSLGTVRHATRLLRDRGLVIVVRSKGVYVARRHGDAGQAMTGQTKRATTRRQRRSKALPRFTLDNQLQMIETNRES